MTQTQTNKNLLDALKIASSRKLSNEELDEQQVSFIMGAVDEGSGVTRERIKEVLMSKRASA